MEHVKAKRAGLRTSFTKTATFLRAEIDKEVSEAGIIRDKFKKLESRYSDIKELDAQILDLIVEGRATEDQVNQEIEGQETYFDEFITLTRLVNEKLNISDELNLETRSNDGSNFSAHKTKTYKLPKIELKKFDGELLNWLPFWSQFGKIHDDPDLHDSDKFQYLFQCMKPGSRAMEFIESYPMTSDNYDKAVSALKERFGKPDLLIEVYVRELIKLIISNVKADNRNKLPLPKLFDKIEAQLRALESLGLKTVENTSWLYPMVESCLSEEVLRAWQRSLLYNRDGETDVSRLTHLMKFLKAEVEGEERLKLARSGFDNVNRKEQGRTEGEFKDKFKFKKSANVPTASGFLTIKDRSCIFCNKTHDSKNCFETRTMSLDAKISKIKDKKCCLKCLEPNHVAKFCKQFVRCYACGKAHLISLCPDMHNKSEPPTEQLAENVQTATAKQTCTAEVALMTLQVTVAGVNKTRNVRALLDCGSQKSYVLKSLAVELGLPIVSKETVAHTLFGGTRTDPKLHNKYRIKLQATNRDKNPEFEFDFLDQEVICGDIPRVAKGPILKELKRSGIWLSDIGSGCPKIEMLIGSDIYGKIFTGQVRQLRGGLTAMHTKLGWAVCGQYDEIPQQNCRSTSILCASLAVKEFKVSDLWNLETIGITGSGENFTKAAEEEMGREQFLSTLNRNVDGRYSVGLPWLDNNLELPSNRHIAEKRLFSVSHKLKSTDKYEDYDKVFKEWLEEGVIEVVPNDELDNNGHYLPHHPVFKPDSLTTKIRPVFDASCKVNRAPSLNNCLVTGPNLIEDIPSILLRFREHCIGVTADIRRAFLQIEIRKVDRDFLRFLWWEKDNVIKVFRHARVVFGVTSSPFLLSAVIKFHLSQMPIDKIRVARKLDASFYIDNCVTSVSSEKELRDFVENSTEMLAEAKMDLRMWTFGPIETTEALANELNPESMNGESTTVLGVNWERKGDTLSISIKQIPIVGNLSKRKILSITQGVFDPLGFLAPALLPAKLLLQEVWATKSDWDSPVPDAIKDKFEKWYRSLPVLSELKLPRRVGFGNRDSWSLHIFCDSSQKAYSTVIFLRCEDKSEVFVSFIMAKSRVAPIKRITIPRLELLGCILGARLSKYVVDALSIKNVPIYYWTDSTTALSWIRRNDQWGTFVGNRVKEICTLTDASQWSYVPSQLNPADLPSRGCSPRQFLKCAWLEGPSWLKGPKNSWPSLEVEPNESLIASELGRKTIVNVNVTTVTPNWYTKFSKFSKIVRILAWVYRFMRNCRRKGIGESKFLSASEIQEAKNTLCSLVQRESFPETKGVVKGLAVIRDQSGLLRVKTQIIERDDDYAFRYPILLPSKHHIVECLILEVHETKSHAGIQALLAIIREEFWIISARRTIRSVVKRCVKCQRFTAKAPSTEPIQLPLDRVRDAKAFEITGIDLCGPLILRSKTKAWVVLFTCAVYRAVHLELATSISTESFLRALRRFIARRGRPSVIYSDNGTNFTGTSSALRRIDWEQVVAHEAVNPITWKFIPPTAAWWGGWWERMIGSTKNLLVRVLGQASVCFEELLTIICDVEAVINSRPLTYVSNESEDLMPLTPSMFIQDIKDVGIPDLDQIDRDKLVVRKRVCQELREQLRSRFRKEYLGQLIQKHSIADCHLKEGDVVLVGSDNQKRTNWPIARIQELYPGRDGRVRVVKVKTANGTLVRPVRKLYPLEVCSCSKFTVV